MILLSALALAQGLRSVTAIPPAWNGGSWFAVQGTSGVSGMQLVVTGEDEVLIIDRIQNNPLQIDGHPAWATTLRLSSGLLFSGFVSRQFTASLTCTPSTGELTPKNVQTNTFCARCVYMPLESALEGRPPTHWHTAAAFFPMEHLPLWAAIHSLTTAL